MGEWPKRIKLLYYWFVLSQSIKTRGNFSYLMDVSLYLKEGEQIKVLKVPKYVVRDLLRDRLSKSELDRINRFAEKISMPSVFKAGSVIVDFNSKTAQCFQAGLDVKNLEPTWDISVEKVGLGNY